MEQLSTLSQTIMALNKKEQMIFRAKFALRKSMPDKKLVHRKYKLIQFQIKTIFYQKKGLPIGSPFQYYQSDFITTWHN